MMNELSKLHNIGPEIERQLNVVGIYTLEDLENLGSQEAWLKIQEMDPSACYNRLLALEGAIQGIPKKQLSQEDKDWLKSFYKEKTKW